MTTRFMRICGLSLGLLAGISVATVDQGANAFPGITPELSHAGWSLVVPIWWYGPNGGICIHTPTGAVQCRPSYGRTPNPYYYRPGHSWVRGHWFRGRWIPGHWS
jgi:hypothetical protein